MYIQLNSTINKYRNTEHTTSGTLTEARGIPASGSTAKAEGGASSYMLCLWHMRSLNARSSHSCLLVGGCCFVGIKH